MAVAMPWKAQNRLAGWDLLRRNLSTHGLLALPEGTGVRRDLLVAERGGRRDRESRLPSFGAVAANRSHLRRFGLEEHFASLGDGHHSRALSDTVSVATSAAQLHYRGLTPADLGELWIKLPTSNLIA